MFQQVTWSKIYKTHEFLCTRMLVDVRVWKEKNANEKA